MPLPAPSPLKRLAALWPWAAAFAPALVLLLMIAPLRVPVPYFDSWAFVGQYRDWLEGEYGWGRFFYKHGDHPSAVGKAIYFVALHWLHGNVGILPLLSWGFSAVIAACVCLLSRPLWTGNRLLGALLMLCASLTIFNPAQGGVWLWDFTYQNYIPAVCLMTGLVVLSSGRLTRLRVTMAALATVIATFSFASGFLVGVLLALLIWQGMMDRSFKQRCLATGAWLAFTGVMAFVALKCFGPEGRHVSLTVLFDRPLMRLQFMLILLGQMLGKGTVFEPFTLSTMMGGALALVFAACAAFVFRHRRDRGFVSTTLPWFACSLYGFANAALVCIGRMGRSSISFNAFNDVNALGERWMAERFITVTLYFVFGVVFLAAAVVRRGGGTGAFGVWLKKATGPVLTVFIAAQFVNWGAGWQLMKMEHILMKQERAMLGFGGLMPLDPDRLWNSHTKGGTFDLAKFLAGQGRLHGVEFVRDSGLASFQRGDDVSGKKARFDKPVQLDDGEWKLGGVCGWLNKEASALPDLILISAEPAGEAERIIALAAPQLPETFFERQSQRRKYPEHYFGWSQTIAASSLPEGAVTLRAYTFEQEENRICLVAGTHRVGSPAGQKPSSAPQSSR